MKNLIFAAAISLIASTASAYTVGIVDMDEPVSSTDAYLAYGSDGRMYEISQDNKELVELAKSALTDQVEVEVGFGVAETTMDALEMRNEITSISLTTKDIDGSIIEAAAEMMNKDFSGRASLKNSYVTDFRSNSEATQMFYTQRRDSKSKSQCFNRAHVWSWEMSKVSYAGRKIQMGKIWVFFTKSYIRTYKYKWWFHIAPYVTVNGDLKVMDRTYTSQPTSERGWTNTFIQSQQACPEVYKYSDYRNYQNSAHCYVMKSSVFYWQPWQLENVESRNQEKINWVPSELKKAYKNAIGFFARVP